MSRKRNIIKYWRGDVTRCVYKSQGGKIVEGIGVGRDVSDFDLKEISRETYESERRR